MRLVKGKVFLAVTLLGILCMLFGVNAEDACEHQWREVTDTEADCIPEKVELRGLSDEYHSYGSFAACAVCDACGEIVYGGSAGHVSHSYRVEEWELADEGKNVRVSWKCSVCQHVLKKVLDLQIVLAGTADNCLYGGICSWQELAYLNDHGQILSELNSVAPADFELGEKVWYTALIYDPGTGRFLLTAREYCAVCGRPRMNTYGEPSANFEDSYNGMRIMTEKYFLTVDMPENLPYQLIDQLREEAGAA